MTIALLFTFVNVLLVIQNIFACYTKHFYDYCTLPSSIDALYCIGFCKNCSVFCSLSTDSIPAKEKQTKGYNRSFYLLHCLVEMRY